MKDSMAVFLLMVYVCMIFCAGAHCLGHMQEEDKIHKEANKLGLGGWIKTDDSDKVAKWQWYTDDYFRSLNTN